MATVEGLFNFDEKLLAREVARNNYGAAIGRSAPAGWGPMMMGVNKIGNAIFNSDDAILKEQTIAQTSLKEVMEELGDEASDNAKLYDALGRRLTENGASAQTLMKLKEVASKQANDQANVDTANAIKQSTFDLQKEKFKETQRKNKASEKKSRLDEFNQTVSDEDHPGHWLYKSAIGMLTGGDSDSNAGRQAALEFHSLVEKNAVDNGEDFADAVKKAKDEFGAKYKFKKDSAWFSDNSSLIETAGTTKSSPELDAALGKYK